MKLSEIKGERSIEVIGEILEPVLTIAADENAKELFSRKQCPEGIEPRDFMVERIREHAPYLLKTYKSELCEILKAISGDEDYVDNLNLAKFVLDITELLTDEEFADFF